MSDLQAVTHSLRVVRIQAVLPKAIAGLLVFVLVVAGLRAILSPARARVVSRPSTAPAVDQGAEGFAQAFTRAYLTWNSGDPMQRQASLQPFISNSLDQNGGVEPGSGNDAVESTYVVGEQPSGSQTLVTVGAQTTNGSVYLGVPVARDSHGFLFIPNYPAVVGPPASDTSHTPPTPQQVSDSGLQTVVARAVTNYLAGNQANLLADLTATAVVSLPSQHMTVTGVQQAAWITPNHSVATQVTATDTHGDSWTLTYDVTVAKRDRWYVQSIEVDPTFQGG